MVKVRKGADVKRASSGQTLNEILNELGIDTSAEAFAEGEELSGDDVPDPGTTVDVLGETVPQKG